MSRHLLHTFHIRHGSYFLSISCWRGCQRRLVAVNQLSLCRFERFSDFFCQGLAYTNFGMMWVLCLPAHLTLWRVGTLVLVMVVLLRIICNRYRKQSVAEWRQTKTVAWQNKNERSIFGDLCTCLLYALLGGWTNMSHSRWLSASEWWVRRKIILFFPFNQPTGSCVGSACGKLLCAKMCT